MDEETVGLRTSPDPASDNTRDLGTGVSPERPADVTALRDALRRWLRDDPWVPGAWSGTTILHWECYACEATLSLTEHTYITPEDAGHIDGTGREERCLWLVARELLAAQPAAPTLTAGNVCRCHCGHEHLCPCAVGPEPADASRAVCDSCGKRYTDRSAHQYIYGHLPTIAAQPAAPEAVSASPTHPWTCDDPAHTPKEAQK